MRAPGRVFAGVAVLLLVGLGGGIAGASATSRLVVIPVENLTDSAAAPRIVEPALIEALGGRGWDPIVGEEVERILREERARRGNTIAPRVRERLLGELDAAGIASVTVLVWRPGRNPIVALSARILGADGTESSTVEARAAGERERAFGLGPVPDVEELGRRAIGRLAEGLPVPGAPFGRPAKRRGAPWGETDAVVLRDPEVFAAEPLRVCLLPLTNYSRELAAPSVAAEVLAHRLRTSGAFLPVEPEQLRAAMRAERIPSLRLLDADGLRRVAARLGTPLFVRGVLWNWSEGSAMSAGPVPEVEIEIELVDVESGRLLWSARHGRRGDDYVGLFLKGKIGTAAGLLDQVLAEILATSERAEPVRLVALPSENQP